MSLAFLPSPARSGWHLGPVPLHAQALCVVAGILLAVYVADRQYRAAGGARGVIVDLAAWAVPAGLVPAVLGVLLARAHPGVLQDLRTWSQVVGFPGAVACGAVGAWLGCLRMRGLAARTGRTAAARAAAQGSAHRRRCRPGAAARPRAGHGGRMVHPARLRRALIAVVGGGDSARAPCAWP